MTILASATVFNRIYLSLIVVGAVGCALAGQVGPAIILLAVVGFGVWSIRRSVRGGGSDEFRVGAAQPMDERERSAGLWSFGVVGMFAIMLETASFMVGLARGEAGGGAWWHLVVLAFVWAAANMIAVRRV